MTLLASVLIPSLVLATAAVEVGCSSDDSSNNAVLTPFDSGTPSVPEASTVATSVTIAVAGKNLGYVVSDDGLLKDGGPNGFAGVDGGAPEVDCPGSCTASQGTLLYAYPTGTNVFAGWSVPNAKPGVYLSTDPDFQIISSTPSPLTANFVNPEAPVAAGDAG